MRRCTHFSLFLLILAGCAPTALDEAVDETGIEGPLDTIPVAGKEDAVTERGPRIGSGADTEVWRVTRQWTDVDAEAGLAWDADSGLDWEEKYDAWVSSLQTEPRHNGSGQTFVLTTPYGDRTFHAPTLECAEVALFLRATFAAWHHLPFYVEGWDSNSRQALYAGHFGFVNASGERVGRFPRFRTAYSDYEGDWSEGDAWPSDSRLRSYRLGDDDGMEWLGEGLGAGAYFDEMFLNKRAGYFLRLILLYFGSANLADGANMFHVQPEATAAGDILVHRWQRRGIGHVMPIFRVERHASDAIEVTIASGSMPRREPVWEEPNRARSSLTSQYGGGAGESSDGPYAALGGGVRRWRQARQVDGRWRNQVPVRDRDIYIDSDDHEAVGARPARFGEILRTLSLTERRDVALQGIEAAREHLRNYPASCAARIRREDAFDTLYEVMQESGQSRSQVDATYRTLEDYVYAALVYDASRTCCWNRSTAVMHGIIMDYADAEQVAAEENAMCMQPTVFRAETTGYSRWADYAASRDQAADWADWSEDETCAQRDVAEDSVDADRAGSSFCELDIEPADPTDPVDPDPMPIEAGCDPVGGGSFETASTLNYNTTLSASVCSGDDDWYRVDSESAVTVRIEFSNAEGDLDMELVGFDGEVIDTSASVSDMEELAGTGPFYVRVYGYSGAANAYTIVVR